MGLLVVVGLAVVGCRGGVKSGAHGTVPAPAEAPADEWTLRWAVHDRIAEPTVEHLLELHRLAAITVSAGSWMRYRTYRFTGDDARRARDLFTRDPIWREIEPGIERVLDLGPNTTRPPDLRDMPVEAAIAWLRAHHPPAVAILGDPRAVAQGANARIRRLHVADRTYIEVDGRRRPACDVDAVSIAEDGRVRCEVTAQAVPAGDGWTVEIVRASGSPALR